MEEKLNEAEQFNQEHLNMMRSEKVQFENTIKHLQKLVNDLKMTNEHLKESNKTNQTENTSL